LALLSSSPNAVIDSRVFLIRQFATSPELTHEISPAQYSGCFLDGVPPRQTVAICSTTHHIHEEGSSDRSEDSSSSTSDVGLLEDFSMVLRKAAILAKSTDASSTVGLANLQSSVNFPEHAGASTALRKCSRSLVTCASLLQVRLTSADKLSILATILRCSESGAIGKKEASNVFFVICASPTPPTAFPFRLEGAYFTVLPADPPVPLDFHRSVTAYNLCSGRTIKW
jgi:hypothetical protein